MSINPAYTGSRDVLSATFLYRHQWLAMKGAPRTQSFFFHSPLPNPRNSFGFSMVIDRLGVTHRNSFNVDYAYRIDLGSGRGRLAFGLQGGVTTLQNNYLDIVTDSPGDAVFQSNSPQILIPGVGFGIYYDTRKFYLGLSAPYLLEHRGSAFSLFVQPNDTSGSSRPIMLATGCLIRLNPNLLLRPSLMLKFVTGSPAQLDLNLNLIIKDALWVGAGFRPKDALVMMLGYQINQQLRFGYAFDQSISEIQRYNQGSHEFMLRYEFGYRMKAMSPRYF